MSWEWLSLFGILIIGILLIIFRNTTFVKSNWKYFIILAPLAILIILKIIADSKGKTDIKSSSGDKPNDDTSKSIENLKDKLVEVQMETAIEISAAKNKNEETIKQLEGIKQIEDTSERRKRLAAMIG
jgi:glucan phosphoethanolaminetransferase (alkaline phosphatase superfamily)